MKQSKISIVIPAYNEEAYIEKCLQSIACQTVAPYEVLVVDNNSTDKTVELAKKFPFVTLIYEKRQGLFFSRNTGMRRARGDVLCRIDADTILYPKWTENVLDIFADPEVQGATGPLGYHDFLFPPVGRVVQHRFLQGARLLKYQFVFGCNMAIRKSAWNKIGKDLCNDANLMEDIDIAIHLRQEGLKICYDKRMAAMVSIRRAEDNPKDFYSYIRGHTYTLRHHDLPVLAGRYAETSFLLGYALCKPVLFCYDIERRRFTATKMFAKSKARVNPMAAK